MSDGSSHLAAPDGFASWPDYWKAQGMPWRTEPEIGEERQRFLAERRAHSPNNGKAAYPFQDEHGRIRLTRADVEWLVADHHRKFPGGLKLFQCEGPMGVFRRRVGVDLGGANLDGVNLANMPLDEARLDSATLIQATLDGARLEEADLDGADGTGATLRGARLDSSSLRATTLIGADLTGAQLIQAHLKGTDLRRATLRDARLGMAYVEQVHLAEADLTGAFVGDAHFEGGDLNGMRLDRETATDLVGAIIGSTPSELPEVEWTALPLTRFEWLRVFDLAEILIEHWQGEVEGYISPPASLESELVKAYRVVARCYQRLAAIWIELGLAEHAAQLMSRSEMLRQELVRRGEDPEFREPDDSL